MAIYLMGMACLLLAPVSLEVSSPNVGVTHNNAHALSSQEIQQKAYNYCVGTPAGDNSACELGYSNGLQGNAEPSACKNACDDAFQAGKQARASGSTPQEDAGGQAYTQCANSSDRVTCIRNAAREANAKKACTTAGVESGTLTGCVAAYNDALDNSCDSDANKAACAIGFAGEKIGLTKDKACTGFSDDRLQSCQAAYARATPTDTGVAPDACNENGLLGTAYLLCPIIVGIDSTVQHTFQPLVENTLKIDPLNGGGSQKGLYDVWNNFRTLANAMLVVAFLVIIFGNIVTL